MLLSWALAGCVLNLNGTAMLEQPIDRVEIDVRHADVDIRAVDEGLPTLAFEFVGLGEASFEATVVDGVLMVADPCADNELCAGSLDLRMPPDVAVHAQIRVGSLRLLAMRSDLMADVGGRVVLRRHAGREVDVSSTFGDGLDFEFDVQPDEVSAVASTGTVHVGVPAGNYALDVSATESVVLDGEILSDPESPYQLFLTARDGAVRVSAR